ncbi:MAG: acetyltransferase [Pseudomonadota bacterium]
MKTDLIIIGAGGHAKVLIDCLLQQSAVNIIGILDNNPSVHGQSVLGIPVLGGDEKIANFPTNAVQLVNAVGSIDIPLRRAAVYQHFKALGYQFLSVVHHTAYVAKTVKLGEGVQIMAGVVLQPDCKLGNNVIINTGASLDHDVQIGDHCHVAPGVVVSGNVTIAASSHLGARAVILQGLKIGERCLIAAGAVVIHPITTDSRVAGVPAKSIKNVITEE